jgi:DNA-directed RNA polymerase specialized sigma24 family protein
VPDGKRSELEGLLEPALYAALWRYCLSLAPTREDAEDLLHETLVQALLRLGQLRERSSFETWVFSIAHRRFLNLRPTTSPRATPA